MSLPSRFAGSITASFIGRVMRPLGGRSSTSIHFQSHSGSGSIVRPIASTPGRNCKTDQRRCRRGRDREAGLLLSVYVPSISGLLSSVCSTRSRSHRPKAAASPRGLVASPTRAGGGSPATVALRKPPPTMPPRRPPPIIPAGKLRPGAGKLSSMTWMAVLVSDSEVRTRVCCKGLRTSGSGHWRRGPIVVPAIE
jgi:hypothetical protein